MCVYVSVSVCVCVNPHLHSCTFLAHIHPVHTLCDEASMCVCVVVVADSCKKTAVVMDDLVSCLEFINCQSMQGQVGLSLLLGRVH